MPRGILYPEAALQRAGLRVPRWLRDPLKTLANTPFALLFTVIGSWLVMGTVFSVLENVKWTESLYWSMTTMSTVGYGDFSPHTGWGRFLTGIYQAWSLFFLLPCAIYHVYERLVVDKDSWDHEEQEEIKEGLRDLRRQVDRALHAAETAAAQPNVLCDHKWTRRKALRVLFTGKGN